MSSSLRCVNNSLIVPPFDAAWLAGDDFQIKDGQGVISFEARADNDITLILRAQPGARRLLNYEGSTARRSDYLIVIGSHRNSRLKIERNGIDQVIVSGVPGAQIPRLGGKEFVPFWVEFDRGKISIGNATPALSGPSFSWTDPEPIPDIQFVGLSTWDRPIAYRNIRVEAAVGHPPTSYSPPSGALPPAPLLPTTLHLHSPAKASAQRPLVHFGNVELPSPALAPSTPAPTAAAPSVPSLFQLCCDRLSADLRPDTVSDTLWVAHLLHPLTGGLWTAGIDYLAREFERTLEADPLGLATLLTAEGLTAVLSHANLTAPEDVIFRGVQLWADRAASHLGTPALDPAHWPALGTTRTPADLDRVLPLVRFPLMANTDLLALRESPLFAASPLLRDLVREALEWQDEQSRGVDLTLARGGGAAAAADSRAASGGGSLLPSPSGPLAPPTPAPQDPLRPRLPVDAAAHATAAVPPPPHATPSAKRLAFELVGRDRLVKPASGALLAACARLQRRLSANYVELLYLSDHEQTGGVLYYIATGRGTRPWRNPVLDGLVEIQASSPTGRFTDPRGIVGRKFLSTSFAGPAAAQGKLSTWWVVDLGPGHRLACSHYTLRHDGSEDFARNWVLQGSNANAKERESERGWSDLLRHVEDGSLRLPGQYASWPVPAGTTQPPYRFFRLLQTGPNANPLSPHTLALSSIELYGLLYVVNDHDGM